MDCRRESECKIAHDTLFHHNSTSKPHHFSRKKLFSYIHIKSSFTWIPGPIIIGAGPSGLAVAACLRRKNIPFTVLERSSCIASLWQLKTYDRLKLHLPKQFCELPFMGFPPSFPRYPTKQQFVGYLKEYANYFDIFPRFNETVVSAEYDEGLGFWRVKTKFREVGDHECVREYLCCCVVAATGENSEALMPEIEGVGEFEGLLLHTSLYRSGDEFRDQSVVVVGCGNSGMEVCLDLCNHKAKTSIVVRDSVHILPQQMLGCSTFGLSMWLSRWLPLQTVDNFLLLVARLMLGDTSKFGLERPDIGPLELKSLSGKTPVLDIGTLSKIKSGDIKVRPGIKRFVKHGVEFVDGTLEAYDAVIFATGYKSNVPFWLKLFSEKDGLPKRPFPNGWKGENGLYAVGFTKRGLMGASLDATRIAQDIEQCWKAKALKLMAFSCPPSTQQIDRHQS